jgi:hypothetical protein
MLETGYPDKCSTNGSTAKHQPAMLDAKLVRGESLLDCHQRVVVDRAGRERFSVAQCAVVEHQSGVSAAAVAEAGDMPDEDLVRPEGVSVGGIGWAGG